VLVLLSMQWLASSATCRADGYAPHEATVVLDERAFQQFDIGWCRATPSASRCSAPGFPARTRRNDTSAIH